MNESKNYTERQKLLLKSANSRILVLDGATGTAIQNFNLTPADFGGEAYEGCNEYLCLTKPEVIAQIHDLYLESGCDIIETNTFGSTPLVLDEYALSEKAFELNKIATEIARQRAEAYSTAEKPRFVAGAIGPTTKSLSVTGGVTFDELVKNFKVQVSGLVAGGADYLLIETAQDGRNIKAALIAIDEFERETGKPQLVAISGTIETMGTMLAGQTVDALLASVMHRDLLYIGLNCATGPEFMTDHIRTLSQLSPFRVAVVPNAGLPDEDGVYLETPEMMVKVLSSFIDRNWVNFLGGCCGTTPKHIKAFSQLAVSKNPRQLPKIEKSILSGIDFLEITDEMRPVIVGERTNVIGSKKFRDLITAGKFEEAADIARNQVKAGAHIIDICLSNPDRDELADMNKFMEFATKVVKAPIMIDSTDEKVLESSLKYCQGKAIINSINLEDGEERFEKVVPLAQRYGAALVVGCIDEDPLDGMAVTQQRKLEVAERSYNLLVNKYGVRPQDIYFDPLVFPCATGDEKYVGSAKETIEGVRLIKQKYPECKTVLGVSNVSFGLPASGREVLNSVFLHHCVQAGLDLAIVNSEKLERYASLTAEDIELSNNLLFTVGEDPVAAFANHFRTRVKQDAQSRRDLPLAERLAQSIVTGSKEGLVDDLNLALKESKPLEIINGPLMTGMDEVGRLFNDNKLIVAEVLQSAEVMKSAVAHLESFMEKSESLTKGSILLATVKGDVHDIGKNLVDIILSNNGFKVINLGIKIPPEKIIEEFKKHKPDMIGLSGLLVKSAQQMVITAEDLTAAGISAPILVGGAALSRNFTEKRILAKYAGTVFYAQDAMSGLDLANSLVNPVKRAELLANNLKRKEEVLVLNAEQDNQAAATPVILPSISPEIKPAANIPQPSDYERHVVTNTPIHQIWKFINPLMLYNRHLGVKAKASKLMGEIDSGDKSKLAVLQAEDESSLKIYQAVQEVKTFILQNDLLQPKAVYQFYNAHRNDQNLILSSKEKDIVQFQFPRQTKGSFLSLVDYVSDSKQAKDNVAMFVVTAGHRVREFAEKLKNDGDFLKSHILQALAIETAEAYAEYLHAYLRSAWGSPDSPEMTMMDRFQAKYLGKRYSFGYPACPNLDDQKGLFEILRPEELGVQLTEGFMMDPEASVSALVFHHPQATYFSVGQNQ